ncbi:MAG TPA: hypothetical protein VJ952_01825 [Opitutales bacterium]|nr:hypothetical protein [Opitutales bacterium]
MKKLFAFLIIIGAVVWLTKAKNRERSWEFIEPHLPAPKSSSAHSTAQSYDGACYLTIDENWTTTKRGYSFDNMLIDIQVGLKQGRAGVLVLAEPLQNAKYYDLGKFSSYASDFTRSKVEGGVIANGPIDVTVGGLKAHQYVIKGRMEDRNIVILHTSLQGNSSFYQIAAITTASRLEKEKGSILKVVRSFRETSRANKLIRPRILKN